MVPNEFAPYFVLHDGSYGCWVGFTPREHAIGTHGQMLDGLVVRLFKVFMPEHPNLFCCALYHRNHGYTLTDIVDDEDRLLTTKIEQLPQSSINLRVRDITNNKMSN